MKTIKLFIYLFTLLFFFSACESDDNESQEPEITIIGNWKFLGESYDGGITFSADDFFFCEKQGTIIFTETTATYENFIHSSGIQQEGEDCITNWIEERQYTLNGNSLIYIIDGNEHPPFIVSELTATTLIIKETDNFSISYTRI